MRTNTLDDRAVEAMRDARSGLVLDFPFFGALALRLKLVSAVSYVGQLIDTAATDGTVLVFNPAYVLALAYAKRMGLIAHEVLHCTNGHCWRRDGRDPERWNVACDYVINPMIIDAGLELPEGLLFDDQYTGRSADWVYDRLPTSQQGQSGSSSGIERGQPGTGFGDVLDSPSDPTSGTDTGTDTDERTETMGESDWKQLAEATARLCQRQGTLPAGIARSIEHAKSLTDWRSYLQRFAQQTARNDYSLRRPNVRYVTHGLYLPSLQSDQCPGMVFAVDTSGSIDQIALSQSAAELQAVHADIQPEYLDVLYCDTKVHRADRFLPDDVLTIDAVGGGGTDFRPVFEHIAASGDEPACLIFFTDLQGTFPDTEPPYPVLWLNYGASTDVAPFGDTIRLE